MIGLLKTDQTGGSRHLPGEEAQWMGPRAQAWGYGSWDGRACGGGAAAPRGRPDRAGGRVARGAGGEPVEARPHQEPYTARREAVGESKTSPFKSSGRKVLPDH